MENRRPAEELSVSEEILLDQLKLDLLEGEGQSFSLAFLEPGSRFKLITLGGEVEMSVFPVGRNKIIKPEENVLAFVDDTTGPIQHSEILIRGASEGQISLSNKNGVIKQFADLTYVPLNRRPLFDEEKKLPQAELEKSLDEGSIIETQVGLLKIIEGKPKVLSSVLDLIWISDNVDYQIFNHDQYVD